LAFNFIWFNKLLITASETSCSLFIETSTNKKEISNCKFILGNLLNNDKTRKLYSDVRNRENLIGIVTTWFQMVKPFLKWFHHYLPTCVSPNWKNSDWLSERLSSLGIVGVQLRTPLKPPKAIVLWSSEGFQGVPVMPRNNSLSES